MTLKQKNGLPETGKPVKPPPLPLVDKKDPLVGTVLKTAQNSYQILRLVDSGGMGSVYCAKSLATEQIVAIKIPTEKYRNRCKNEVIITAKIIQENIVGIREFGNTPAGDPFFVMDYLKGSPLETILEKKKHLNWNEAKPILVQLCDALQAVHNKSIIHRDIKPANIFLEESGGKQNLKLLDFGIARMNDGKKSENFAGTVTYAAPEQFDGKEDHRSDIYSVGVVLYEILTGSVPFKSSEKDHEARVREIIKKHQESPPPSFKDLQLQHEIPEEVENIIRRTLEKKPEARFQSMEEMKKAILSVEEEAELPMSFPVPINPKPYVSQKNSENLISHIGRLLFIAGIAGAIYFSWHFLFRNKNDQDKILQKPDVIQVNSYSSKPETSGPKTPEPETSRPETSKRDPSSGIKKRVRHRVDKKQIEVNTPASQPSQKQSVDASPEESDENENVNESESNENTDQESEIKEPKSSSNNSSDQQEK